MTAKLEAFVIDAFSPVIKSDVSTITCSRKMHVVREARVKFPATGTGLISLIPLPLLLLLLVLLLHQSSKAFVVDDTLILIRNKCRRKDVKHNKDFPMFAACEFCSFVLATLNLI